MAPPESALRASVAALNVYPVKSCRGIAVDRAGVTPDGLELGGTRDREWMIVDAAGGFVTQREQPLLALLETEVADGRLRMRIPGLGTVVPDEEGPSGDVVVWNAQVRGHDGGNVSADALSAYLGVRVRLVRFDDAKPRRVNPDYAGTSGATTLYADAYPLLVIGAASLRDLNERLASRGIAALPMNRFRPNLVLEGLEAYDEDHIETMTIGDVVLKPVKPSTRCEITTTDQATGRRSDEPLRTLSTYRRDDRLAGVTFGMNAIVVAGAGASIRVGDAVEATLRF